MFRHRMAVALVIACVCMPAWAQNAPCTVAQSGVKFKNPAGTVLDWWPKTTEQPTGGSVNVVDGNLAIAIVPTKPTKAQITAGVAPDALGMCFPIAKLARNDKLEVVLTVGGKPYKAATCLFETGDLYNIRNYGSPPKRLATVEPRIVSADGTGKVCSGEIVWASTPPVADPPATPPVVTPPPTTSKTWVPLVNEWQSFDRGNATVRYGVIGNWREATVSGYTMCSAAGLGFADFDPAPNSAKTCELQQ